MTDEATTATEHDDALPTESAPGASRKRLPAVLITIATILAFLSVFSVWVRVQALDTDEWVSLSDDLLAEDEVRRALAEYLVNTAYDQADVTASISESLPPNLAGLASPIATAFRDPITDAVDNLLGSERFGTLWRESNRIAHRALVAILRGESGDIASAAGGAISLDLKPLVVEVAQSLGLSGERIEGLPEDTGRIVIFQSEDLAATQDVVALAEFLAWALFVLVLGLYLAAVYVATDRMRTLRTVGWSVVGVGVAVLAARAIALRGLVDGIVQDPGNAGVAEIAGSVVTGLLRQMGWSAVIYGALTVLFTSLMGEHRWAVDVRRVLADALNSSRGAVAAGTTVVILLLVWWSPGGSFEQWTTALALIALVIGAVITLRKKTMDEQTNRREVIAP